MNQLISSYRDDPTCENLCEILINELKCDFLVMGWNISNNIWYVPLLYDSMMEDNKSIDGIDINNNQGKGWYISEELSIKSIPVKHSRITNIHEINTKLSKLIYGYVRCVSPRYINSPDIPIQMENLDMYLFIVESYLNKITSQDMLKRQKFRQELMLSNISHSIRTPLNGILHMTKNIVNSAEKNNADLNKYAEYLNQSAVALATNIFDIVDMTKLELGRLSIEKEVTNLKNLVNSAITLAHNLNRSKNVTLDYFIDKSAPEYIFTDVKRTKQILINLLENALQHTNKGEVFLYVSATTINLASEDRERENSINDVLYSADVQYVVNFSVKDTGSGMDDNIKQNLFKPAELLVNSKRQGLSLRISSMLAQILGGKLSILYSEPGIGTCIDFSLITCEEKPMPQIIDLPKKVIQKDNCKILVVEDEYINRIVIEKILKQLGYKKIDLANNGEDALKLFDTNKYDILLIDVRMPLMTGFELADNIYDICNKANIDIPKMLGITAQLSISDNIKPWFKDFIYKPIDIKELDKKIEDMMYK